MSGTVEFDVPGHPPSTNQSYVIITIRGHGSLKKTKAAKDWQRLVALHAGAACGKARMAQPAFPCGDVSVLLVYTFDTKRRRDIDGPVKATLDAMEGAVYTNDTQVTELHVVKRVQKEGPEGVHVRVDER